MNINEIALENFRSHRSFVYRPEEGVNIVCGSNGRGKTNLLEAIFLLTGAKSWRTGGRSELICWGGERARIRANIVSRGRDFDLLLDIPAEGRAKAMINGVAAGRDTPLAGVLRAVLFSPEDLQLVKGAPAARRELMNSSLSQLWPRYSPLLSRYSRLILTKGRLLRKALDDPRALEVLPEINVQIASLGAKIIGLRADFCRSLAASAAKVHSDISAGTEVLELEYKTVSSVGDCFAPEAEIEALLSAHLAERKKAEIASAGCLVGPHRDDIEIRINGHLARSFASQGQARSAALALRFAQRELYFADLGEYPVLLLDDILSELDDKRRDFVCESVPGGQCIITCCGEERGFRAANVCRI